MFDQMGGYVNLSFRNSAKREKKTWFPINRDVKHFCNMVNKLNFYSNDSTNSNGDTLPDSWLFFSAGAGIRSLPRDSVSTVEPCEKASRSSLIDSKTCRTVDCASLVAGVCRSKKKSQDQETIRENHRAACRRAADRQTKMDAIEYATHRRACRKCFAPDHRDMVASPEVFASQQRQTTRRHDASGS